MKHKLGGHRPIMHDTEIGFIPANEFDGLRGYSVYQPKMRQATFLLERFDDSWELEAQYRGFGTQDNGSSIFFATDLVNELC